MPPFSKAPASAPFAAASRSASAKTTFGFLPPSSRLTRLSVCADCSTIRLPTSVERLAHAAVARDDVDDAGRDARLEAQLAEAQRGQRRLLGRLQHDGVAAG